MKYFTRQMYSSPGNVIDNVTIQQVADYEIPNKQIVTYGWLQNVEQTADNFFDVQVRNDRYYFRFMKILKKCTFEFDFLLLCLRFCNKYEEIESRSSSLRSHLSKYDTQETNLTKPCILSERQAILGIAIRELERMLRCCLIFWQMCKFSLFFSLTGS